MRTRVGVIQGRLAETEPHRTSAIEAATPFAGLVATIWIIGAYAIIWGVLFLALAFRLRGHKAVVMITT